MSSDTTELLGSNVTQSYQSKITLIQVGPTSHVGVIVGIVSSVDASLQQLLVSGKSDSVSTRTLFTLNPTMPRVMRITTGSGVRAHRF